MPDLPPPRHFPTLRIFLVTACSDEGPLTERRTAVQPWSGGTGLHASSCPKAEADGAPEDRLRPTSLVFLDRTVALYQQIGCPVDVEIGNQRLTQRSWAGAGTYPLRA